MKFFTLIALTMTLTGLHAQWDGTYYGTVSGDNVVMNLEQNGNNVTGVMKDSYQTFDIKGTVNGNQFSGTTTEQSYQIAFGLTAEKSGNTLECILSVDMNGETGEVPFTVEKQGETVGTSSATSSSGSATKIPFPSGATFPAALVGTWVQNENYNSGSGDSFMGASFSQSMTFNGDGTLSEGGSSASMSGSNYSGQSTGGGAGKLDGIGWYAKQKNFYLIVYNNNKWESVHVGTWYTENNALLLTGNNGEKLLLTK